MLINRPELLVILSFQTGLLMQNIQKLPSTIGQTCYFIPYIKNIKFKLYSQHPSIYYSLNRNKSLIHIRLFFQSFLVRPNSIGWNLEISKRIFSLIKSLTVVTFLLPAEWIFWYLHWFQHVKSCLWWSQPMRGLHSPTRSKLN